MLPRLIPAAIAVCLVLLVGASALGAETEARSVYGVSLRAGMLLPLGDMSATRDLSPMGGLHLTQKYFSAGASFISMRRSHGRDALNGFVLEAGVRVPLSDITGLTLGAGVWIAGTAENDWDLHAGLDAVLPGSGPVAPDFQFLYRYAPGDCAAHFLTLSAGIRFM